MSEPVSVFIADSQDLTRFGLRHLIEGEKNMNLSGEAVNSDDLFKSIGSKSPDVLILDYKKTGDFKIGDINRVREVSPKTNILVISADEEKAIIHDVLGKGVNSFLTKECDQTEIKNAIYATAKGEKFFCGKILEIIFEKHYNKFEVEDCLPTELTTRELEIVEMITQGYSTKKMAETLCLSHHTIYTHKKNVMKKLAIKSTSELILYAVNIGLAASNATKN
ncbi:MAG: response regulator transcription factor [Bacteroidetes bacterium]|nr:response regulator transcription factor [Bacteroidota bacterium]MDA1119161.1 response regulator transcription factor [Bacteroidota bacterium]